MGKYQVTVRVSFLETIEIDSKNLVIAGRDAIKSLNIRHSNLRNLSLRKFDGELDFEIIKIG